MVEVRLSPERKIGVIGREGGGVWKSRRRTGWRRDWS